MLAPDVRWSEGASSSEGTTLLTSGAPPTDPNSRYIWEDWVFGLSNKMLGFISSEFRLGNSAHWAVENERLLIPYRDYMTFSEAILKTRSISCFALLLSKFSITLTLSHFSFLQIPIASSWRFTLFFQSIAILHL